MLWLADGTVACVEVLPQITPDSLEARLIPALTADPTISEDSGDSASGASRLSLPLAAVRALAFEPSRLLPLGSLPISAATSDRPWTPALVVSDALGEPLGAPDITFPAPMSATWVIPPDALRLAFSASLPARSRVWGDCELLVTLDQDGTRSEISRTRFNGEAGHASVNISLPVPADPRRDRRLTIEVLAGPSGPAQDTLILTRPLLLRGAP